MADEFEDLLPHEVSVLDEAYLQYWETSVGAELMPSFIADLRATFEADYAERLSMIADACRQGEPQRLIQLIHHLKGSLGNIGLMRASAFARQAEVELRTDQFNRFDTFPDHLKEHINEGLAALQQRYP